MKRRLFLSFDLKGPSLSISFVLALRVGSVPETSEAFVS